ncbi:hypothetical protein BDB01DRAFT_805850 [Pilobolus umbonatus]|nr:hypothetical protein BDB01DRAFT_805850 [Pilobolus umbonatus]
MVVDMDTKLEQLRSNMMTSEGGEEKVEVNQRHLIDKILARYSAEFVLYRELMQNADDASSSAIQIHFQTSSPDPTKQPNLSAKCEKIIFKNNGMAFRPEDWTRLKRIAEGNPDEQKIGAFGVGFYSLFSVCENPFVFSGKQCMAFYFRGDQLFAKRADVNNQEDEWTSFLMDLREPMEMPNFDDFSRFLTTSMGFTANLRQISVFFDQHPLFTLIKRVAEPRSMAIDTKSMIVTTPQRMFTITNADMRQIQLDSEKYTPPSSLFTPFSLLTKPKEIDIRSGLPTEKASIFLRVVTGTLQVNVSREFEKEMERATKKKPPKTTKFQLVYTGKEELDASENRNQIFKELIPFPHQGRVFIGFPTHQTTGCCCHMASRFIPTVERESIDFADRYISVWNKELLCVGGLLARMVYNDDMEQISRLYKELVGLHTLVDKSASDNGVDSAKYLLEQRAAHALHSFTFQPSTPSAIVGTIHEERFFKSSKAPFTLMTSHGTQPITRARTIPDSTTVTGHVITQLLDVFIKTIPTLTPVMFQNCKESLIKLTKLGLLTPLGLPDVLQELESRSLTHDEMVACMKWWIECNKGNSAIPAATRTSINENTRAQFLGAAVMDLGGDQLLQLSQTQYWRNPKTIPLDIIVPPNTMPFTISKNFSSTDLSSYFGQMSELSVFDWIIFICDAQTELETSKEFAERVLMILSKQYPHMATKLQTPIHQRLAVKKCIPTKFGLKLPHEAYFTSVNLFDDLPIIQFTNLRFINTTLLSNLGVRKHVELQMVFDRLISDGSWSHLELIKYLISVQSTLTELEIRRLRGTAIFTKEGEEPVMKETQKEKTNEETGEKVVEKHQQKIQRRYRACDLFAPTEIARDLNLPLIEWGVRWRSSSDEAKFLERLGLITTPPLGTLLTMATPKTNNKKIQKRALNYLIDNYKDYESSYDADSILIKFIPCADGKTFASPRDCFTNPDVKILGFNVLHHDLIPVRDKLKVRDNPTPDRILEAFFQQIQTDDEAAATKKFEFMAGRMGEFSSKHWQLLRQTPFIPVKQGNILLRKEPSECYFESEESASFHKELFLYVHFGSLANSFLRSCGVKDEPTTVELAAMIVKDPQRFWDLSSGGERYLSALRQIAGQFYQIKLNKPLFQEMKSKPFLVGIKKKPMASDHTDESVVPEEDFVQYRLAKASDIFISDDTMGQQIFAPLSAPMEPLIEDFYASLGSQMLSSQIKEQYSYSNNIGITPRTKQITEMIFERTPIIIYQMMNDNPQRRKELLHDEKYVKRNLKVIQAKELKITRIFKYTGEKDIQLTTACADTANFIIYVSNATDIDYYDVANSLCRLLFARVQFNDAIIVERYLVASLYNLRRKGVPVDRILNIRKQEQNVVNTQNKKRISTPPPTHKPPMLTSQEVNKYTKQVQEVFGDCHEAYIRQLISQQSENHVQNVIDQLLHEEYPKVAKAVTNEDEPKEEKKEERVAEKPNGFINRLWSTWKPPVVTPPTQPPVTMPTKAEPPKPKLPRSESTITPNYTENIRQNLKRAIHSCKPFTGQNLYTPPRINQVTESSNYCDMTSGQNLTYVGNVMGVEFYVHRDTPADDVIEQYGASLKKFIAILNDLSTVFGLPMNSVQIFYDKEGSTIAFNTSGSLFMNLRFFLALHEDKKKEALIYWFMTFCHELAHNFIGPHNSEHEFYMSSFAETYLDPFMSLIQSMSDQ